MEYYASICRLCESRDQTGDSWVELFSPKNDQVLPMIRACANIVLCENDELPQRICGRCYQNVELSYNFKMQCEVTDARLRHEIALRSKNGEGSNLSVPPFLVDRKDTKVDGTLAADEVFVKTEVEEDEDKGQAMLAGESDDKFVKTDIELKIELDWNPYKKEPSDSESADGLDKGEKPAQTAKKTPTEVVQSTQQSHICETCGNPFENRSNLTGHKRTVLSSNSQCSKCLMDKFRLQFECPQCDKKYVTQIGLKNHMQDVHSDSFPHVCDKCGKGFARASKLRFHYTVHIETRDVICDICKKGFKSKHHLRVHMDCHLRPGQKKRDKQSYQKIYVCPFCGKKTNGLNAHNTHVGVHTGEKKYECHICFRRFNSESSHRKHKLVHTGEKPYVCQYCQKAFRQKHHVNQHIRGVHNNEKPYKCKFCPRAFVSISLMRGHEKSHGEPIGSSKQEQQMPLAAPLQEWVDGQRAITAILAEESECCHSVQLIAHSMQKVQGIFIQTTYELNNKFFMNLVFR